jgi:UDP-N-acetylglucosamine 2-epimerase (non-hydrolysing)
MRAPWPEEANRVLTSHMADLHFAPTETNRRNLLKEGIAADKIFVTGNTVIDALLLCLERIKGKHPEVPYLPQLVVEQWGEAPLVLITGHRRENFGEGFESICRAITRLAGDFPNVQFVYPVHLNPNVRGPVLRILGRHGQAGKGQRNIHLLDPLPYLSFVALMERATLILTDSGGIQEEAPSLGKPVLVMRDVTERPEALESGTVKLVGTDEDVIVEETALLLTDSEAYKKMAKKQNPYGDGKAAQRIVEIVSQFLDSSSPIRVPI